VGKAEFQLKHAAYWLLYVIAFTAAIADDSVLPQDFFVSALGRLHDTTEIKQLSRNTFELKQQFRSWKREPMELDFMTFCAASAIAVQHKFNGWTATMEPVENPKATDRLFTIVLLNDAKGAEALPHKKNDWLPYRTAAEFRPTCSTLVNPQYLWPGVSSVNVEKKAGPWVNPFEVGAQDKNFPQDNPHPSRRLSLTGMLPRSLPVDDIEIRYRAGESTGDECRRTWDGGGGPFIRTLVVPLTRVEDTYKVEFYLDQYLPGQCEWHFREMFFRMHLSGFVDPMMLQYTAIHSLNELSPGRWAIESHARPDHGTIIELWCINPPRYIPISCMEFGDFANGQRLSAEQIAAIPPNEREYHGPVPLYSDVTAAQINFHQLPASR
jgi:hypothetical protein